MKKPFYILFIIFLYLACFSFIGMMIVNAIFIEEINDTSTLLTNIFFYCGIGLSLVALTFGSLGAASFRPSKFNNDYKFIMIIKIILIPFYILNYLMYFIFIFGSLFTFGLQVIGSILFSVGSIFTYLSLVCTSFPITFMCIYNLKKKKEFGYNILILIFSVLFCLDVVASILAYCFNKPTKEQFIDYTKR